MKRFPDPVKYKPIFPNKYVGNINEIVMRSSWESHLAFWLDKTPSVLKWGSEIKAIPYYSTTEQRIRNYYPDFWALIKQADGTEKRFIVEIKPQVQVMPPKPSRNQKKYVESLMTWQKNQDKWKAAREYANKTRI